jgi:hypothetical protein
MIETNVDAFLNEGVSRYTEAKRLLEVFRAELVVRLKEIGASRNSWGKFQVDAAIDGGEKLSKTIGDSVWAVVKGKNSEGVNTQIEYGVWWNPPKVKAPAAIYAYIWKPNNAKSFMYNGANPQLKTFVDNGYTFLYLVPEQGTDLVEALSTLFNELGQYVDGAI